MADSHQVRWTTGRGLSIPAARRVRLVLDGDHLVLHDASGRRRTLAPVARLVRAHTRTFAELRTLRRWPADPADRTMLTFIPHTGMARVINEEIARIEASAGPAAVVLSDTDGPVITLPLVGLVVSTTSLNDLVDASGVADLVRELGLTVDIGAPLDRSQRAAESRVLLRPSNRLLSWSRLVLAPAAASFVVTTIALEHADWPSWPHVVACMLAVGATLGLVRSQMSFTVLTKRPPSSAGRAAYTVPGAVPGTQLQLGPQDVVIVRPFEAEEVWLGGPRSHGVTEVEIGGRQVHLRRADGRVITAFERAEVAPTPGDVDSLRACCTSAGIGIVPASLEADVGSAKTLPLRPTGERAGDLASDRETGQLGLTVPGWCAVAAAAGLVGPLGPGADIGAMGWVLVASNAACLLAVAWGALDRWRWRRRAARTRGGS